jgi:hypothetical protein
LVDVGVHQGGLSESGHRRRRSRLVPTDRQQLGGGAELLAARRQVAGRPQVSAQPLVGPGRATRRHPARERLPREHHGPVVARRAGRQLGGLPETVAAVLACCSRPRLVPQLEGPFELAQGHRRCDGLGGVGGHEQGGEGAQDVAGAIEVERELTRSVRRHRLGLAVEQGIRDPAMEPPAL